MTVFYGYPGQVWAVVYGAMNTLASVLSNTSNPFGVLSLAETVLNTAINGLDALTAYRLSNTWQGVAASMAPTLSLPLSLSPVDVLFFQNRLASFTAGASGVTALVPPISMNGVNAALAAGNPAIPNTSILEFFAAFDSEAPPAGLSITNLPVYVAQSSQAFFDIAAAIGTLPNGTSSYLIDINSHIGATNAEFSPFLGQFYGFKSSTLQALWNQMFVLPTMLMYADWNLSAPNTLAVQQDMLVRYLIIDIIQQLNQFILTTDRPINQPVSQATVLVNDSLMDIAARGLGNYEQWAQIAALNNLQPPYISASGSIASGIAGWGSQVQLPTPGTTPVPGITPNYLTNFLGVDIYFGPINGDMPTWTGDFQAISGYDNLRWALGRRMQTSLGTLIYDKTFGSQIPPEIGRVQTQQTAGYIAAFGKACLLSDPRVASVPSATATLTEPNVIAFAGIVQPAGFGAASLNVNTVINSSTTPRAA